MRIRIEIDDRLLEDVLRITGLKKREVVELALLTLLRQRRQDEIRRFREGHEAASDLAGTPTR